MQPPRIIDETPPSVRLAIDILIDGVDAVTRIRAAAPKGSSKRRECDARIAVLYADCAALLSEWERDVEIEPRPSNCGPLCSEYQGPEGCNGSWYCTDARREELRRAA